MYGLTGIFSLNELFGLPDFVIGNKNRRRKVRYHMECGFLLVICNKAVGFCNELLIYFADEVGPIGFAQR